MLRRLLLPAVLLIPFLTASAQTRADSAILAAGARLRVTIDSDHRNRFTGVLVAEPGDTLRLQPGGGAPTRAFPRAQVLRLEVSRGRKSQWRVGAMVGLLVGTGVAFALVQGKTYEFGDNTPWIQYLVSTAAGGVVGGVVGANIRSDRWQVVPWPESGTAALPPESLPR